MLNRSLARPGISTLCLLYFYSCRPSSSVEPFKGLHVLFFVSCRYMSPERARGEDHSHKSGAFHTSSLNCRVSVAMLIHSWSCAVNRAGTGTSTGSSYAASH